MDECESWAASFRSTAGDLLANTFHGSGKGFVCPLAFGCSTLHKLPRAVRQFGKVNHLLSASCFRRATSLTIFTTCGALKSLEPSGQRATSSLRESATAFTVDG
jgi:hypothetical protein